MPTRKSLWTYGQRVANETKFDGNLVGGFLKKDIIQALNQRQDQEQNKRPRKGFLDAF